VCTALYKHDNQEGANAHFDLLNLLDSSQTLSLHISMSTFQGRPYEPMMLIRAAGLSVASSFPQKFDIHVAFHSHSCERTAVCSEAMLPACVPLLPVRSFDVLDICFDAAVAQQAPVHNAAQSKQRMYMYGKGTHCYQWPVEYI
jgi:hypothetical protein